MVETVACPTCRRPLRVPDTLLGQTVECPGLRTDLRRHRGPGAGPPARDGSRRRSGGRTPRAERRRVRRPTPAVVPATGTRTRMTATGSLPPFSTDRDREDEDEARMTGGSPEAATRKRRARLNRGRHDPGGRHRRRSRPVVGPGRLPGGCFLWPGTYFSLVCGILCIIKGAQMLSTGGDRETPPMVTAILQVVNVINLDLINVTLGIITLVFINDDEVREATIAVDGGLLAR